jgi:hypothetical protein
MLLLSQFRISSGLPLYSYRVGMMQHPDLVRYQRMPYAHIRFVIACDWICVYEEALDLLASPRWWDMPLPKLTMIDVNLTHRLEALLTTNWGHKR